MPDMSGLPDPTIPMDQDHDTIMGGGALNGDTVKFTTAAPSMTAVLPERQDITSISKAPDSALLENFLRRPVNIHTFTWTDATVSSHIDPWALFLNTSSVSDKITFYKYLRGTLHLDIQLNGTPFHFGRIISSYEPTNWNRLSVDGIFPTHSALPHVMLDPSANTVGKLDCPFIHPSLWIDLTDPYGAGIGVLNFDVVAPLSVFEGGTPSPVTVQVYAWLEDVELSFPTQEVPVTFTEQAKKSKGPNGGRSTGGNDEYSSNPNAGLISAPAAAIANVAGRLTDIPMIGPFMTATQVGAGAVSKIAKLFGYSRPKDITADCTYLQNVTGPMAVTDAAVPAASLTVNSKSELSIDPRVVGMSDPGDELAINAIASKWAIAQVIDWSRTDSPGTLLEREGICPGMFTGNVVAPATSPVTLSPIAYASLPFKYWHGSMEVRIQVVASRYHRGRLRFQWTGGSTLTQDIQKGYNHVVDISDSTEYHFKLPYVGKQGFKLVSKFSSGNGDFSFGNYNDEYTTGVFSIIVQNELVCPTDESVKLIVWVRGGEDIAFCDPDLQDVGKISLWPRVDPPPPGNGIERSNKSAFVHIDTKEQGGKDEELGTSAEKSEEMITFFDSDVHDKYDLVYFGDPVDSFRSLMKRYMYITTIGSGESLPEGNFTAIAYHFPLYPQMQGQSPNGSWNQQIVNVPVNVTNTHLMTYLSVSYLAMKGGCRHILDFARGDNTANIQPSNLKVKRATNTSPYYGTGQSAIGETLAVGPQAAAVGLGLRTGSNQRIGIDNNNFNGGVIFPYKSEGHRIEVEVPFYYQYRYATTLGGNVESGAVLPGDVPSYGHGDCAFEVIADVSPAVGGPALNDYRPVFDVYSAASEDFTMHFFRGVPQLYYDTLQPSPSDFSVSWRNEVYPTI